MTPNNLEDFDNKGEEKIYSITNNEFYSDKNEELLDYYENFYN